MLHIWFLDFFTCFKVHTLNHYSNYLLDNLPIPTHDSGFYDLPLWYNKLSPIRSYYVMSLHLSPFLISHIKSTLLCKVVKVLLKFSSLFSHHFLEPWMLAIITPCNLQVGHAMQASILCKHASLDSVVTLYILYSFSKFSLNFQYVFLLRCLPNVS